MAGRSVSYQWTGTQLTQVTDVMGNLWKYEYDGNGQITSRTDPVGFKTTVQYSQSIKAPEPLLAFGQKRHHHRPRRHQRHHAKTRQHLGRRACGPV
ncbi:RHS repeat protein [Comamonas odontotermitis]|nr:RHS repeat protein [Comamonas odontotermitis]